MSKVNKENKKSAFMKMITDGSLKKAAGPSDKMSKKLSSKVKSLKPSK